MQIEIGTVLQAVVWGGSAIVGAFVLRGAYEKALQMISRETGDLKLQLVQEISKLRMDIQLLQQSHQTAVGSLTERITRVEEHQSISHAEMERQRDRTTRISKDVAHLQGALNLPVHRNGVDTEQSGV